MKYIGANKSLKSDISLYSAIFQSLRKSEAIFHVHKERTPIWIFETRQSAAPPTKTFPIPPITRHDYVIKYFQQIIMFLKLLNNFKINSPSYSTFSRKKKS